MEYGEAEVRMDDHHRISAGRRGKIKVVKRLDNCITRIYNSNRAVSKGGTARFCMLRKIRDTRKNYLQDPYGNAMGRSADG